MTERQLLLFQICLLGLSIAPNLALSWTIHSASGSAPHLLWKQQHESASLLKASTINTGDLDQASEKEERDNDAAQRIYSMPALYDLAFGYRDYEEEVDVLLQRHEQVAGFDACRILDIAAGPGRHAINALQNYDKTLTEVTCIDLSPQMSTYAQDLASEALTDEQRSKLNYIINDIRNFSLPDKDLYDTAWILLGSLSHLTRNEEVISCLKSIHSNLRQDGTVVIELPHPRETFDMIDCTRNDWTVPLEDDEALDSGELRIIWGDEDDAFDPITQVRQLTIEMKLTGMDQESGDLQNVKGIVPTRLFTAQEINALAMLGGFEVKAMYGSLEEEEVSVDDEDAAFRLICILQKV